MKIRAKTSESFDAQLATREAVSLAQSFMDNSKPWGALNIIAPNLNVNVYWGDNRNTTAPGAEDDEEDDDNENLIKLRLDLNRLSKPTQGEIAYQLCLKCT